MKYRKKPIVVEAVQYEGKGNLKGDIPQWIWDAFESGILKSSSGGIDPLMVKTLEGELQVPAGWWIIQGIKGELYPCKPDIFEVTYEKVAAGQHLQESSNTEK